MNNREKEIKDITDVIFNKFGYDRELYFMGDYNFINYDLHEFVNKLSIKTFEDFKNNGTIVLYEHHVSKSDDPSSEDFYLELRFGYLKKRSIPSLSKTIKEFDLLIVKLSDLKDSVTINHDLLPKYKELLRRKQIDKIL